MITRTIGFLGAGNMATALVRGLLETKTCTPERLSVSDVNADRLSWFRSQFQVMTFTSNLELVQASEVLVLAVKPQQAPAVLEQVRGQLDPARHCLVSIAAGLSTVNLEAHLQRPIKVVRVMPNTPARVLAGATAFCLGRHAGEPEAVLTQKLFGSVGEVVQVKESEMNAVTALSGSGPAYIFKLCEMMINAGRELGLSESVSGQLAVQTVFGAGRMLKETGDPPGELRRAVTSPGGTTQAAIEVLERSDFEAVFLQALRAAVDRAQALSAPTSPEGK